MSKKANPAAIGAFVLAALVVAAIALVVLGSGKFFKTTREFVVYFESSLSGLDVGAPVECHGVRVGTVTKIMLEYEVEKGELRTPVYIQLERDRLTFKGELTESTEMAHFVERNLRAQLQAQSLVTGKLKIMLLESPHAPLHLVGKDPETPEIGTMPTLTESITKSLQDLPLSDIVTNLNKSMESIANFTSSSQISNSLNRLASILEQVDALSSNVSRSIPSILQSAKTNVDHLVQMQEEMSSVLKEVKLMMGSQSPERQQLNATLKSLEDTSDSLKNLLDYLQLHPEAIISGKKE